MSGIPHHQLALLPARPLMMFRPTDDQDRRHDVRDEDGRRAIEARPRDCLRIPLKLEPVSSDN